MMRQAWALGAMIVMAGMMGACDSSQKSWNRESGSAVVPPAAAPAPAAPVAVASVPAMPAETPAAAPVVEVAGTSTKPALKADAKAAAGKVVSSAEAKRVAGHYYLTILAVKSEELARNDAKFLASHGVSVSVEKTSSGLYRVMSVDGFAKVDAAAKAFQAKVVAAGKEFPGAKAGGKGAWDDAYFARHGTTTARKAATTLPGQ
jgi:hypothetical protein